MSQCEWIGVIISIPWFFSLILMTCLLFLKEKGMIKGVRIVFEVMRWVGMLFVVIGFPLLLFGESLGQFYFEIIGLSKVGTSLWSSGLIFSLVILWGRDFETEKE